MTFAFLGAILILVGIHEFGHFVVARLCKVKVLRFSIGFGKPLLRWIDKKGTEYVLAALPLGGYVKLLDSREAPVPPEDLPFAFDQQPIYQRAAILSAGPIANIMLAIVAYWLIFSIGVVQVRPIIGEVTAHSIAATAGLKSGDEIIAIGGNPTHSWTAVAMRLMMHYGDVSSLEINTQPAFKPKAMTHLVQLDMQSWKMNDLRPNLLTSIGIKPYKPAQVIQRVNGKPQWPAHLLINIHYPFWYALLPAVQQTAFWMKLNFSILYKLINGSISWKSLGGPFSIFQGAGFAANHGLIAYISFLGFLSISIAIMNILPIPGLDGGQLLYLVIEAVIGRPVSIAFQILAFRLGLIWLCILFLQLLLNDMMRLL